MSETTETKKGLLIVPLSPKVYMAGGETGIAYEVRLPNGDWFNFSPTSEKQHTSKYDTMSCTTFSALNSVEMQINWLIKNDKLSQDILDAIEDLGFFDSKGNFNCSDWFTAVMSGTTKDGNDFGSVWDSIRKDGLLPQADGYAPSDFDSLDEWLDRTKVSSKQKEKALKILELFEIKYEFVLFGLSNPDLIVEHLKQAPIHIGTPTCNWGGGVIESCGVQQITHATCSEGAEKDVSIFTLDHYNPMHKKLAWDYCIPWAVKGVVSIKAPKPKTPLPQHHFGRSLRKGDRGTEVAMLQKALKALGYFTLDYTTDYFGYYTEQAVKDFQLAYADEVLKPWGLTLPTGFFGLTTIKKLNELLQ